MEDFIISKEDFKKYFNCRKIITEDELRKYYMEKNVKKLMQFLMQRQDKVIKNEVKRREVEKNTKSQKWLK